MKKAILCLLACFLLGSIGNAFAFNTSYLVGTAQINNFTNEMNGMMAGLSRTTCYRKANNPDMVLTTDQCKTVLVNKLDHLVQLNHEASLTFRRMFPLITLSHLETKVLEVTVSYQEYLIDMGHFLGYNTSEIIAIYNEEKSKRYATK